MGRNDQVAGREVVVRVLVLEGVDLNLTGIGSILFSNLANIAFPALGRTRKGQALAPGFWNFAEGPPGSKHCCILKCFCLKGQTGPGNFRRKSMRRACWIVLLEFLLVIAASRVARGQGPAPLNLVGVWQAHFSTPLGPAVSQTILMPDGGFTKTVRAGGMMTWDAGMYSVGQGYIHFYIHDHEPKIYKGVRMHWVTSETVFFHMTGPDRMICEDRVTGNRWQAYRVR